VLTGKKGRELALHDDWILPFRFGKHTTPSQRPDMRSTFPMSTKEGESNKNN